jgi:hypothetical protein
MSKFVVLMCLFVGFTACKKTVPGTATEEEFPIDDGSAQCLPITSCSGAGELAPLLPGLVSVLTPLLPKGPQGERGLDGFDGLNGQDGAQGLQGDAGPQGPAGQSVFLEDVLMSVIPFLPQGPQGIPGFDGLPGTNGLPGVQGDVGPQGPPGPTGAGEQGPQGLTGDTGSKGDKGDKGDAGPTGEQGPAGSVGANGSSNTSVLTATRVFNAAGSCTTPPCDYVSATPVNTQVVFVPPVLNVVYGDQGLGLAYVSFGTTKCTYKGNNKSGSALALYEFLSCADGDGNALPLGPGQPFAFNGTLSIAIGAGSGTASTLQIVAYFQIQ